MLTVKSISVAIVLKSKPYDFLTSRRLFLTSRVLSTFNTANNQNQKPRVRMHITRNIKVNLSETLNTANSHIVDADQGKSNKKDNNTRVSKHPSIACIRNTKVYVDVVRIRRKRTQ